MKLSFLIALLLSISASAKIIIPGGLTSEDRKQALRTLGWGTSSKILSNPYPLGGYSGLEIGMAIESLPVDDIGRLGNRTTPIDRFTYPKISIGKGLYNNVDFFVHFIPFDESTGLSEYGFLVRWGAYQAKFLPASISFVAHSNSSNIDNKISCLTTGLDIITGINVKDFALYLGGGPLTSTGRYMGGPSGITDSGKIETETEEGIHTLVGMSFNVQDLFTVIQIDQYNQAVYSTKLGVRF